MSSKESELLEWCQALGHYEDVESVDQQGGGEEAQFVVGAEALNALRGMELMLRRDSPEQQPLYLHLGHWQTVRTHLLPLLLAAPSHPNPALAYHAIKVLVRLTLPLSAIVENKPERTKHLQEYKAWFLEGNALLTLMFILSPALETHSSDRTEPQRNLLELGLTLLRNLLSIPDPKDAPSAFQAKLHDRAIVQMHEAMVLEALVMLAQAIDGQTDASTKYLLQDCFVQLFRQETDAELLFGAASEEKGQQEESKEQTGSSSSQKQNPSSSKVVPLSSSTQSTTPSSSSKKPSSRSSHSSSFVSSETDRLTQSLSATLAADRAQNNVLRNQGMARHARFGGKYAIRVVAPSATGPAVAGEAGGTHVTSVGPDGEKIASTMPMMSGSTSSGSNALFAARLVRNPFGSSNQRSMINDSLAKHHGKKPVIGATAHTRIFLSPRVKEALHHTASLLLDGGGFNVLMKAMHLELSSSATKDLVLSDDARNFMQLQAFLMQFHRIRMKTKVKKAEKEQKAREKIKEEQEKKERERMAKIEAEERKAMEEQAKRDAELYGIPIPSSLAPSTPNKDSSASMSDLFSPSQPGAGGSEQPAPVFPNRVDSEGRMVVDSESQQQQQQVEGQPSAPAVASSSIQDILDDGIDETLLSSPPPASSQAQSSSAGDPSSSSSPPPQKPFIREVCFDASCIRSSVSFDSWQYLNSRIKLYLEDRPIPWPHLASAIAMYTELVRTLYEMHAYGDAHTKLRADSLRRSLFYDRESVELFSKLLQAYKPFHTDSLCLSHMVLSVHYQMRMLEDLSRGGGYTILEKKKRKVRRRTAKKVKDIRDKKVAEELKPEGTPNAAGAGAEEEKKPGAPTPSKKGSLFPDLDEEGNPVSAEEDSSLTEAQRLALAALATSKEVSAATDFTYDENGIPVPIMPAAQKEEKGEGEGEGEAAPTGEDGEEGSDWEEVEIEEETPTFIRRESEFDFTRFLMRYAQPTILSNYMDLLSSYRTNSLEVNLAILTFMQRLSKAHLGAFFWQLSVFVLFERLLTDPWVKSQRSLDELRGWIKLQVVRPFIDRVTKKVVVDPTTGEVSFPNRHLWIEILFWKNFQAADRLGNEEGWFDASRERARSARDAAHLKDPLEEEEEEWIDIDEEEEERKKEQQARAEAALAAQEEQELQPQAWQDTEVEGGKRVRRPWTSEEDEILKTNYPVFQEEESVMDILCSMLPLRTEQQVRERMRKLGLVQKKEVKKRDRAAASASASGSHHKSGKKGKKKGSHLSDSGPILPTLAEMLDRHEMYTRVAPIDDVMDEVREVVLDLVRRDARLAVAMLVEQLKACKEQRVAASAGSSSNSDADPSSLPPFSSYPFTGSDFDPDAVDSIDTLCRIMGIRDVGEDTTPNWIIPTHFGVKELEEYIGLIEATLDSEEAQQNRQEEREEDDVNAESLNRLLDMDRNEDEGEQEQEFSEHKEPTLSPEEEEAAKRKEAKRLRREERQRREALELSQAASSILASGDGEDPSSSPDSRPRRRRKEDVVAERIRKEVEMADARRARQREQELADEAAEAEYQPSADTAMGEEAVEAAKQKETALTSHFARDDLNDFMARKRKRVAEVFTQQAAASSSSSQRAAAAATASPPKKAKKDTKRRLLRRATQASDEEEEEAAEGVGAVAAPSSPAAPTSTADEEQLLIPETEEPVDLSASAMQEEDEEEEEERVAAPLPKKKKNKARRIQDSDEEEEEEVVEAADLLAEKGTQHQAEEAASAAPSSTAEGEDNSMEVDDTHAATAATAVDTQAETQQEEGNTSDTRTPNTEL